jgi:uncharacterized membrane protein YqjE
MGESEPSHHGVLESLRKLCDQILALIQNRLELFAVELQEEKERLIWVLVLAALVVFLSSMAAVVVTVTIVVLAGERLRGPVLVGLSVLYVAAAVTAFLALRKQLRTAPPPFNETVSEFKKDRDWLESHK